MSAPVDIIPLEGVRANPSSFEYLNTSGEDGRRNPGRRRVSSAYVQKNRMSRYKIALRAFTPFRYDIQSDELPVDTVSCCSNFSFFWVRSYLVAKGQSELTAEEIGKDESRINPPPSDRADLNAKRLLAIYKDEKQTKGRHGSMLKVAWNFCRTRVIFSSLFYALSTMFALVGPVFFLKNMLENFNSLEDETRTILDMIKITQLDLSFDFSEKKIMAFLYLLGFISSLFLSRIFDNMSAWLTLRTSIRFRSAVLSGIFRKAIRSSIVNNVAAHQIISGDIEIITDLVNALTKLLGTILAIILSLAASIFLLRSPGIWPVMAALGFFFVPVVLSKISTYRIRQSLHFLSKKMSIVESFCVNFKDIMVHALSYDYIQQFLNFNTAHFSTLRSSKVFDAEISAEGMTAVLLGGLYLIWCDSGIRTDSDETLILVLIYAFFLRNYVIDYCRAVQSISNGRASLDKVKNAFSLALPDQSRQRTTDPNVLVSMSNCSFKSNDKVKFTFDVTKGSVFGITGVNAKTLLYGILSHNECVGGTLKQRGTIGFNSEDPFLFDGSLKDNILMGSAEIDTRRYYTAIALSRLNDDVMQTIDADGAPIESLHLTMHQKERVALARMFYSDRDLYLFDEPFNNADFSSDVLQLFANSIHQVVAADRSKAVIICSSNPKILNICSQVFDSNNGSVYTQAEYERFSSRMLSEKMTFSLFDNVKGCNPNALRMHKKQSQMRLEIGGHVPQMDESTEYLVSKDTNEKKVFMGCMNSFVVAFLTFFNVICYISLIIGFIIIIEGNYVEPWLELLFLGSFFFATSISVIVKTYLATVSESKRRKFHKHVFEKLLSTSLDFLCGTNIADILNWFCGNAQFMNHIKIMESIILIIVSVTILLVINFWLTSAIIIISVVAQLAFAKIIYRDIKTSVIYYTFVEYETRKKLLQQAINNLRGRCTIQSFDRTPEFCKSYDELVEDSSTAIFLRSSIKNYATFINYILMTINIFLLYVCVTFIGDMTIYSFTLCIILFYLLTHQTNVLIEAYVEMLQTQSNDLFNRREIKNVSYYKQIRLLYEPKIRGASGIPINFKNVEVKLCGETILMIKKLDIKSGDIVGISGAGCNHITSVLFKLLKPITGAIFVSDHELNMISQDMLHSLITVVPQDLQVHNLSIVEFLNPKKMYDYRKVLQHVTEALPEAADQYDSNELMQLPMKKLSKQQKQLLCLVKAKLSAKVVIIEFPESNFIAKMNEYIIKNLIEKTILIIGTSHLQLEICNRVENLFIRNFSESY